MRVLLAEDHPLIRAGIRSLLIEIPGVTEILEAADAGETLETMRTHRPDVVLLHIGMPGFNGLEGLRRVSAENPESRIVVLAMAVSEDMAREALGAGANGVLVKADAITELQSAIEAVRANRDYVSSSVRSAGVAGEVVSPSDLTPRQREILEWIARGFTSRQIAEKLGVHLKTVESHRTDLMRRLGIHNVAGLVRYAIRHGLVKPNEQ